MANNIKATVTPQNRLLVTNYSVSGGNLRLNDLFDVDATGLADGAVLLYNGNVGKWQATVNMDNNNTNINGGNY
jgi:hypothetical protein